MRCSLPILGVLLEGCVHYPAEGERAIPADIVHTGRRFPRRMRARSVSRWEPAQRRGRGQRAFAPMCPPSSAHIGAHAFQRKPTQ